MQCLVSQVRGHKAVSGGYRPRPPIPGLVMVMWWRRSSEPLAWQLALTIQLVAQVKLAPFVDDRLDVVSGMRAAGAYGEGFSHRVHP